MEISTSSFSQPNPQPQPPDSGHTSSTMATAQHLAPAPSPSWTLGGRVAWTCTSVSMPPSSPRQDQPARLATQTETALIPKTAATAQSTSSLRPSVSVWRLRNTRKSRLRYVSSFASKVLRANIFEQAVYVKTIYETSTVYCSTTPPDATATATCNDAKVGATKVKTATTEIKDFACSTPAW